MPLALFPDIMETAQKLIVCSNDNSYGGTSLPAEVGNEPPNANGAYSDGGKETGVPLTQKTYTVPKYGSKQSLPVWQMTMVNIPWFFLSKNILN